MWLRGCLELVQGHALNQAEAKPEKGTNYFVVENVPVPFFLFMAAAQAWSTEVLSRHTLAQHNATCESCICLDTFFLLLRWSGLEKKFQTDVYSSGSSSRSSNGKGKLVPDNNKTNTSDIKTCDSEAPTWDDTGPHQRPCDGHSMEVTLLERPCPCRCLPFPPKRPKKSLPCGELIFIV